MARLKHTALQDAAEVLFRLAAEIQRLLHLAPDEGCDPQLVAALLGKLRQLRGEALHGVLDLGRAAGPHALTLTFGR